MTKNIELGNESQAILTEVVEKQGKTGTYLMWVFQDQDGNRKVGFTESEIRTGNRPWTWLCMLGIVLRPGDVVDLKDLTAIECSIFIDAEKDIVRMVAKVTRVAGKRVEEVKKESSASEKPVTDSANAEAEDLFN